MCRYTRKNVEFLQVLTNPHTIITTSYQAVFWKLTYPKTILRHIQLLPTLPYYNTSLAVNIRALSEHTRLEIPVPLIWILDYRVNAATIEKVTQKKLPTGDISNTSSMFNILVISSQPSLMDAVWNARNGTLNTCGISVTPFINKSFHQPAIPGMPSPLNTRQKAAEIWSCWTGSCVFQAQLQVWVDVFQLSKFM